MSWDVGPSRIRCRNIPPLLAIFHRRDAIRLEEADEPVARQRSAGSVSSSANPVGPRLTTKLPPCSAAACCSTLASSVSLGERRSGRSGLSGSATIRSDALPPSQVKCSVISPGAFAQCHRLQRPFRRAADQEHLVAASQPASAFSIVALTIGIRRDSNRTAPGGRAPRRRSRFRVASDRGPPRYAGARHARVPWRRRAT